MKKLWMLLLFGFPFVLCAQNVGIGTSSPVARLQVVDSAVVFSAPEDVPPMSGNTAIEGAGRRMMWHPDKAAFRVGYVSGNAWDDLNIGSYSFAAGKDVVARAPWSVAMGLDNVADGFGGIAIGSNCRVLYNNGFAIGNNAQSGSSFSFAIGNYAASYSQSFAIGNSVTGWGNNSIAIGNDCYAASTKTLAIGNNLTASGTRSTAMGNYVSTSNFEGAFALGDASTTTVMESFVANGFRARFAGGYRLFTNSTTTIGAFLNANANSWAALSDVRMKENFLPVDGEAFLKKIAAMPQVSWNYIGQDAKTLRHYGPMAQDFYAAFGKDDLGEIGCDTLINQQDFLGVNLIAIQALEKRTEKIDELEKKMEKLEMENTLLKEQMKDLQETIKAGRGAG